VSAARRSRYDPQRQAKAANLSTGVEVSAEPYRKQIEAGLRRG